MPDLLLIRPNDQKNIYTAVSEFTAVEPPFWAASIAAYVRQSDIHVEILDAEAGNLPPEKVVEEIEMLRPKLIGIIITGNHLSAATWKMNGAGFLAKQIKARMETPVFMWGLHVSALPEKTLMEENTDYVVKGESLKSIVTLTKSIINGEKDFSGIPGVYYRDSQGNIMGNSDIVLEMDLDDIPSPAWDLLPMKQYRAHNWHRFGEDQMLKEARGYGVIATSLGCPYHCSYCAISALFGSHKVRFRSVKRVLEDIDVLVKKYQVYYIKILDENFVLNKDYVEELCDEISKKNYDLNMWAYARIDTVDENILGKLRKANIKWLCYGIESANESSMQDVQKGQYDTTRIREVVEMTKKAGINIIGNIMFGLPEDDFNSMNSTLMLAKELNCEWINMYSTMAFPGSKLYEECVRNGGKDLPESWIGYSELSYEAHPMPTKYLTSKEVLKFRDYAFNEYFNGNDDYFQMIEEKFGKSTVEQIKRMLGKKLKRKLLEEP